MIYIVLPAFNEEKNMQPLLANLAELAQSVEFTPVLIDDGSADNTAAQARLHGEKLGIRVVQHEVNRGLGAAVLTGLRTVCETAKDDDVIVLLDADNTHNPKDVLGMMKLMNTGNDVVIASRYVDGAREVGLSHFRSAGSRLMSLALASVFHVDGARDYTCGYRCYRVSTVRKGFEVYGDSLISETSFVCMAELLVKLFSIGARIAEFPLILRYDLKQGESKLDIKKTLKRYLHFVVSQARTVNGNRAKYAKAR